MVHKSMRVVALVVILCFVMSVAGFASQGSYRQSNTSKMGRKLGRGIVNVLTGWMEIPKSIAIETRETDMFTGLIVGTIQGLGMTWARMAAGVFEIFTFPIPVPEGYQPVMEPEYILPSLWGEPLPMMDGMEDGQMDYY